MRNELFCQLYETGIKLIKVIEEISKECDMFNSQEHLDFLDKLNEISVSY